MGARGRSGVTLIELLVVMAILAILSSAIAAVALRASSEPWKKRALADMSKLSLALDAYDMQFRTYPPDTGYGLRMTGMRPSYTKTAGGTDREVPTYDPGSLWRYLTRRVRDARTQRWYGPFLEWEQGQMRSYQHTRVGDGLVTRRFYLTDPWGNPYGFIGEPKRVRHNQGSFDLFSAGPDGVTACNNTDIDSKEGGSADSCSDNPQSLAVTDNRAYNSSSGATNVEIDDDGDGTANNAVEFGPEAGLNGDVGDDLNNWSPH